MHCELGFPTGRDSATFRDKGTEVSSLSRDKGTTGQAQNLAKGRAGTGFSYFSTGRTRTGRNFDILPRDGPGRDFDSLSRPVPEYPGTATGQKGKKCKKSKIFAKKKIFLTIFDFFLTFFFVVLSRDVPGQRSLSRDFCCCSCPGTKGQRDKETFLSRDKGTTGRPVPVCPGTSRGTSRPVETLV